MTNAPVLAIDILGIDTIKLAHALSEVGFRGFNHNVLVVGHLTLGMATPLETSTNSTE